MKIQNLITLSLSVIVSIFSLNTQAETRPFHMGLTDFPHAFSQQAIDDSWFAVKEKADMVIYHEDREGIPWTEAAYGLPYPAEMIEKISYRLNQQPVNHKRYLAVTPINFMRDTIAPLYKKNTYSDEQHKYWNSRRLNDPVVKWAYYRHVETMVAAYNPHYLAFAIEANILINKSPDKWADFVELMQSTYTLLKNNHPDLPIFITFSAEHFWTGFEIFPGQPFLHATAMQQVTPYSDIMAISTYPFMIFANPADIPANYLTALMDMAPNKPFAISETTFPAEDVTEPYPVKIMANQWWQAQYTAWLLGTAKVYNAKFVNWFVTRDYDGLWDSNTPGIDGIKDEPDADLLRLWRDTGLLDGEGNDRIAMQFWHAYYSLPYK